MLVICRGLLLAIVFILYIIKSHTVCRLYLASAVGTVCTSEEDLALRHSCWHFNCWVDCWCPPSVVSLAFVSYNLLILLIMIRSF